MNVKFHQNCGKTEKFGKFHVYFLRLQKEIFLVLLQMIYYIFSP